MVGPGWERTAMEIGLGHVLDALPAMVWTALPDRHIDFVNRHWSEFTSLSWTKPKARTGRLRPRTVCLNCSNAGDRFRRPGTPANWRRPYGASTVTTVRRTATDVDEFREPRRPCGGANLIFS